MDVDELHQRCLERLAELGIPASLDLAALCTIVRAYRQRPLRFRPMPLIGAIGYGLWVATPSADYFLYERTASAVHRLLIILHEISHPLWGHGAEITTSEAAVARLLGKEGGAYFESARPRGRHSLREEREAEIMGTELFERVMAGSPPGDMVEDRLISSLEGNPGHPEGPGKGALA